MTSLVKNQIAKQLARFTKNLSPNKISVKFLKGEGELHNLELDEKILSDLLELPPWLRITKADCNKISAKIHWTKLKTDPICLFLDCIQIEIEEVHVNDDSTQSKSSTAPTSSHPPPPIKEKPTNRYGFVEKVVDGMYVQINSVLVAFKSPSFTANFQMSRLIIQSTTPEWKPDDLRNTRLKDEVKGEVLTFKEITWSTLRIDAHAQADDKGKASSAPIRLITSQSSLQIAIKKRIEDCTVLSACLKLLLDDILWVLTQSQLQALMVFMNSLNQSINSGPKKAPSSGTTSSAQMTQQQTHTHTQYSSSNLQNGPEKQSSTTPFAKYDLLETSYHLRTGQIDLHLSDDSNIEDHQGNKAKGVDQLAGGAMQIRINKLATDYYPYHLAGTSRTRWECHNEASLSRAYWVNQLLNTFRNNIRNRKVPETGPPRPGRPTMNGSATVDGLIKSPTSPTRSSQTPTSTHPARPPPPASPKPSRPPPPASPQRTVGPTGSRRPVFMYEECYLIRCEEFAVMPVTTYNAPDEGTAFLSSDKKALYLPTDMPAFQVDYTQYYYPSGVASPVPPPNLFVQLNPVQLTLDTTTCIWFNRFMTTILGGGEPMECMKQEQPAQPRHLDIRFEALMPKIVLPCPSDPCVLYRELRPQALQIQMSQMFFTNSRVGTNTSQTELLMLLQTFTASKLYADYGCFPNDMEDVRPLPCLAWVKDAGVVDDPVRINRLLNGIQPEPYQDNCKPSQVWCLSADQVWADFLGIASNKDRPMPFIDAIPVRLWICTPLPDFPSDVTMTSQQEQPITVQQNNRQPQALNPNRQRIHSTGRTNWYASIDEADPENEKHVVQRRASERLEREKCPEPHSAASSPGCARHNLAPAPMSISKSSPNLKRETDGSKPIDIASSGSSSGVEVNGHCHSLPPSPRTQASGFEMANTGSIGSVKSDPVDNLSLNSQPCSSSSQEDFILIENSESAGSFQGSIASSDYKSSVAPDSNSQAFTNEPYNGTHTSSDDSSATTPTQGALMNGVDGPQNPGYLSGKVPTTNECPEEETLSDVPPMEPPKVADMSVLAYIPANVVVQLEHFNLIFLFRLQEVLEKLKEEVMRERQQQMVASDVTAEPTEPNASSMTFSLQAKGASVNIILPPSPEPTMVGATRDDSSLSSYLDPGFVSDGGSGSPDVINDPENCTTSPDAILKDDDISLKIKLPPSDPSPEALPVDDVISGEVNCGRVSAGSVVEPEGWIGDGGKGPGITRGRRDSEISCTSSQLGTSVDSSAKSSARGSGRIVSVFNAEGADIHMGIHMEGDDMALKLIAHELKVDEKGNCNIDKYLNQKSFKSPSRESKSIPIPTSASTPPVLSVRAEFGPGAERYAQTAGERGFAHVQVGNVSASLLMSSMESLSDCFDDEVIVPKMPMFVEMKNSCVSIRDDKPPRLLSAPPPLPINVNIETLTIFRNHEGVVNIKALSTSSEDVREAAGTAVAGFRDSPKPMSRQLSRTASESSLAESLSSRSDNYDSERESVRAQLSVSRAALHAVQEERQALLKTIERLQMEVTLSNRETDRLQARVLAHETGTSRTPSQRRKSHR